MYCITRTNVETLKVAWAARQQNGTYRAVNKMFATKFEEDEARSIVDRLRSESKNRSFEFNMVDA